MPLSTYQFTLSDIFTSGISGASASVIWAQNLLRKQRATDKTLLECASRIVKNQGFKSLFKGTFKLFCYNSFARFGDVSSNFLVLNTFKNNEILTNTPIFIQSWFSWVLATANRICITPLQIYANPYNFRSINGKNTNYIYLRAYLKQIKPQILALYGWLMVQNYLIQYTEKVTYADGYLNALSKYIWIGFLSMISYDCYKKENHYFLQSFGLIEYFYEVQMGQFFVLHPDLLDSNYHNEQTLFEYALVEYALFSFFLGKRI